MVVRQVWAVWAVDRKSFVPSVGPLAVGSWPSGCRDSVWWSTQRQHEDCLHRHQKFSDGTLWMWTSDAFRLKSPRKWHTHCGQQNADDVPPSNSLFLALHVLRCRQIPTLLKMEFEGGVVLKFHFKIPFLQSCFLNDQYSSSFHVIGKQVKIKYLRLAPEELSTCQTEAAHANWTKLPFYPPIYWPWFPNMTCELPGQSMYNGYKHSYKKEHLPRARLNLAVSKDQVKLGRGRAGSSRF